VSRKPGILIHTALSSEAKPIASRFNLRQHETKPFRIYRGKGPGGSALTLLVSGVGRNKCTAALESVFGNAGPGTYRMALNVGMAGCNDRNIRKGSVFSTHGGLPGLPELPLFTSDSAVKSLEYSGSCLVDMEAEYFLDICENHIPGNRLFVVKVVSDYLDDFILPAGEIGKLIENSISSWEFVLDDYPEKMESLISQTPFENLEETDRDAIRQSALRYRFSHQELKQIIEMALDFRMWDETDITTCLSGDFSSGKEAYVSVKELWENLKHRPKSYSGFTGTSDINAEGGKSVVNISRETPGFGRCPVASEKTRCCNLLTLDAVEGCGYDCSYCSIRYFYDSESIGIDENFIRKLQSLEIDPGHSYHIGTGQSSDSLMWGNRNGILDALLDFASEHPNVILELKTKSDNIAHLLARKVPENVLTTWSLNPQVIIDNEEHFTASLEKRLVAAGKMAEKGNLIGFHFHPMVYYDEWKRDYRDLFTEITKRFQPEDTAMISLGTLTFIKPVIRKMRERKVKSRILEMPLEDAEGKLSYPLDIKREMFRFAYKSLSLWHDRVFFYMCMEDISLWKDVFGYEYPDNDAFELAMIQQYEEKIREKRYHNR